MAPQLQRRLLHVTNYQLSSEALRRQRFQLLDFLQQIHYTASIQELFVSEVIHPRDSTGGVIGKVRRLLLAALATAAMLVLTPATAQAAGCYGDWCTGKDPAATGCAADAVTVAVVGLHLNTIGVGGLSIGGDQYGQLELRWSARCKTNWARVRTWMSSSMAAVAVVQESTNKMKARWIGGNEQLRTQAGSAYSPMIYSPKLAVRAFIIGGLSSPGATTNYV
ncbi:DUF2690 domain-containing protein [Candidatus Saccharibacteria bacterium]|nr:DUF2690 domain-containing protein [Candidatus Saccharibacteria bacterium]